MMVAQLSHMFPLAYSSLYAAHIRSITRPDGSCEYPICDYLGSVRFTLHESGKTVEGRAYEPFGSTTSREGEGAGTAYTGVETDAESDLGFHGVRWYDSDWGRFLSVDKLWEKYDGWTPYQYALNCLLTLYDNGGDYVRATNAEARQAIRESVPSEFRNAVQFNDDGFVQIEPLKEAAKGQDVNSNVAILSRLAENEHTIEVTASDEFKVSRNGLLSTETLTNLFLAGITLVDREDVEYETTNGEPTPISTNGLIQVFIMPDVETASERKRTRGQVAAHELIGHVRLYLLKKYGKAWTRWYHSKVTDHQSEMTEDIIRRAEDESGQ